MAGSRSRSLPCWRTTPPAPSSRRRQLHRRVERPNLFIKIPGTPEGLPAIEEAIFAGIPINVTLLFSREQYLAAAEAYQRGIERRIEVGPRSRVGSVASVFISRWDKAVQDKVPADAAQPARHRDRGPDLCGVPGAADSRHVRGGLAAGGARPQRLLWASTGTKDPQASDVLYVEALAAPDTINTMPDATLLAFADHGELRAGHAGGWRRRRSGARRVRAGRCGCRRAGRPASAAKAPRRSSSRGTSCSSASPASPRRSQRGRGASDMTSPEPSGPGRAAKDPASSIGSASTPSARYRSTPCRRPNRGTRERRWRRRPRSYCLWQRFLRYDPEDPHWPNRDRFVLSNGHASMLLYSLTAPDRE